MKKYKRCPLRCGPGGTHGPRCRFSLGHQGVCQPSDGNGVRQRRMLLRFRQDFLAEQPVEAAA